MRTMGGRPVLLQRFRDGADGSSFFQKRIPTSAPEWLETTTRQHTERHDVPRARRRRHRARRVGRQPRMPRLPRVAVPRRRPRAHRRAALGSRSAAGNGLHARARRRRAEVHALLDEKGVVGYPKTTGNRGLHVYVRLEPRWDSYQVRSAAVAVARELERRRPDILTAAWWKEERGERVFVDFNQNAPHKTVFGAWSVRARSGAQVSTPLALGRDRRHPSRTTSRSPRCPHAWRPKAIRGRDMNDNPQSLEPLLEMYERDRADGLMDAPWPPVYPKQPDEPPRVAPSRARKD